MKAIAARSANAWRNWLERNHQKERSVWLIIYRKESQVPSVYYDAAVDEALCFGWVDSKVNKRDGESYYQYFAQRNPKSKWSGINKEKVGKLEKAGKMTPAGQEMIRIAKANGNWAALDGVENLEVPADLARAFKADPAAASFWEAFPRSAKRGILEWILSAKKEETRQKRILETVTKAAKNERANSFTRK